MPKAALIVLPKCRLRDISPLLEQLAEREWRLRVLSLDGRPVTTAEGFKIQADASMQDAVPLDLQLCIIPGGHYTSDAFEDIRLQRFLRQYDGQRRFAVASCEGVICLAAAGLMGGIMYSSPAEMMELHGQILRYAIRRESAVTVDGNVVSSDGSDAFQLCNSVFMHLNII